MVVEKLSNSIDLRHELKRIGVDGGGVSILEDKGHMHVIRIRELHVGRKVLLFGASRIKTIFRGGSSRILRRAFCAGTVKLLAPRINVFVFSSLL